MNQRELSGQAMQTDARDILNKPSGAWLQEAEIDAERCATRRDECLSAAEFHEQQARELREAAARFNRGAEGLSGQVSNQLAGGLMPAEALVKA